MKLARAIDRVNDRIGNYASYIILAVCAVMVIEVFMRSVLTSPTKWAYDMTWMLGGIYAALGFSYCYLLDRHVRMDLFYDRLSTRGKAIAEVVYFIIFFVPMTYILIKYCGQHAIESTIARECTSASLWRPPVYPFKLIVSFGFLLFGLQGVSNFIKNIAVIRGEKI
ncbi:MAG: TRAP transporter small permease subunit [Dehalococcoidia bacterium]|nr:TRAP transporter small permease subunit [Dehalococcoidia bacterium]